MPPPSPPPGPPPTPEQIAAARALYRARLAALHQLAAQRDQAIRSHSSGMLTKVAAVNALIAQQRTDTKAAREALRALLEH
jgi:hypothetical protein